MAWFNWLMEWASRSSPPRTVTTWTQPTAPTTTDSSDSSPGETTQTTLFSREMATSLRTQDGSPVITVNVGLREAWKDWEISSVVTHSRSLSLTLTRTQSPRSSSLRIVP